MEERLLLRHASDTRGTSPFFPSLRGRPFPVLQIPTTLPTMDEVLGADGVTDETLPCLWLDRSKLEWNVLTVHAEMEGMSKLPLFGRFLTAASVKGFNFPTLGDIAERPNIVDIPSHEIVQGALPGRAATVAVQGGLVLR